MARRKKSFTPRRDIRPEHRLNHFIRVPQVRLTGDNIEELNEATGASLKAGEIYPTNQLRSIAENAALDLVEIAPDAKPPVVRIIDYRKFLYQKKKREKELKSKASKQVLKEIRFGPETADHDFDFKVRHAKNFLEGGNKVKAYVQFRGRSIVFKDRGQLLLLRFMKELEELGAADQMPKLEGRRMIVILSPTKKAIQKAKQKEQEREKAKQRGEELPPEPELEDLDDLEDDFDDMDLEDALEEGDDMEDEN